jgi:cytoskeletal protein RodZ
MRRSPNHVYLCFMFYLVRPPTIHLLFFASCLRSIPVFAQEVMCVFLFSFAHRMQRPSSMTDVSDVCHQNEKNEENEKGDENNEDESDESDDSDENNEEESDENNKESDDSEDEEALLSTVTSRQPCGHRSVEFVSFHNNNNNNNDTEPELVVQWRKEASDLRQRLLHTYMPGALVVTPNEALVVVESLKPVSSSQGAAWLKRYQLLCSRIDSACRVGAVLRVLLLVDGCSD